MEGAAAFVGVVIGIMISAIIWGFVALPYKTDLQFEKDCKSMVHGTVSKDAHNLCVKNGKILFHK